MPDKNHSRRSSLSQNEEPIFKKPQQSDLKLTPLSAKQRSKKDRRSPLKEARVRHSSRLAKPFSSTSSSLNVGSSSESAAIAAKKLGFEDVTFKIPSSLPSVHSPNDKACSSSVFSSPPTSLDGDASLTGSKVISVEESFSDSFGKIESVSEKPLKPKCPVCKATIDSLFLEGLTKNRRLTLSEQANFCNAHRRRTADEEWNSKGYPTIDWSFLHMQVKIHREAIDEIIKGERFSYYRNAYDDLLKRKKHKTLQQTLMQGSEFEEFSPGYYGSRGNKIMHASNLPIDQEIFS